MSYYNKRIHRCVQEAGVVSDTLGTVLWTCYYARVRLSSACCGLPCTLNPHCLGPEDCWVLGTSVEPLQLYVWAQHVDYQLFLQCGGEAAVFTVELDFLVLLWFSGLRSIVVVFRRVVCACLMWITITCWRFYYALLE